MHKSYMQFNQAICNPKVKLSHSLGFPFLLWSVPPNGMSKKDADQCKNCITLAE